MHYAAPYTTHYITPYTTPYITLYITRYTAHYIRKLYNMRRISISKYLNSLYYFYCNKSSIEYKPIFIGFL